MLLKYNLIANYLGRFWTIGIGIAVVPLYIRLLGTEAYGLIGFYASLLVALTFFDMGMSQTLVRESARWQGRKTLENERAGYCSLVKTLELVSRIVATLFFLAVFGMAEWLSARWLHADSFSPEAIAMVVTIMGAIVSLRWTSGIYRSILMGLERQVWVNSCDAALATLRSVGSLGVLVWVSPTVMAYFVFQGIVSLLEFAVFYRKAWGFILPVTSLNPSFSISELKRVWRFSGAVALVSVLGMLISQADKLMLPGLLTLREYGVYVFASLIGRSVLTFAQPVTLALRPRLTALVAGSNEGALRIAYFQGCEIMAFAVIPFALWLAIFSEHIIYAWSGDFDLALRSAKVTSLLAIGSMLNAIMHLPFSLQLAFGRVRLGLVSNTVLAIVFFPSLLFGVTRYGADAAGWAWVVLNSIYVVFTVSIMHRRHLQGLAGRWYLRCFALPLFSLFPVAVIGKFFISMAVSRISIGLSLTAIYFVFLFVAALSLEFPRGYFFGKLRIFRQWHRL